MFFDQPRQWAGVKKAEFVLQNAGKDEPVLIMEKAKLQPIRRKPGLLKRR
jgi:hypothetical protein